MDLVKVLCSGSKGNCTVIKYNNHSYVIDMGVTYKKFLELSDDLVDCNNATVFITHSHSDHIKGINVFSKNNKCQIYGSSHLLEKGIDAININKRININDIEVEPIFLSHDCKDTLGYVFYVGKYKIVVASDTGYLSESNLKTMDNPDVLLLEANHDVDMLMGGSYSWPLKKRVISDTGHLSNTQFLSYVSNIVGDNTKHVVALHLSEENNDPRIVETLLDETSIDNTQVASQLSGSSVITLNWRKR